MKDVSFLTSNGVNVEKSLELFGDMQTYNDTLEDFLKGMEESLPKIKMFKEEGDMANYAILVHSLKSDSKYFGFTKLAELALQHEMQSKANDIDFIYLNYDELMNETNRIIKLVSEYLGKDASNILPKEETVIKDKTILVVDDSNIVTSFVDKIFSSTYNVLLAKDGMEALTIVSNHINDGKIVAMLLDLNMPNVDGFQVLEWFKQYNLFKRIPISIITGEYSKEVVDRAFTYDIVDMLAKPFNEKNVKAVIEKTIDYRA
ncbi:MAG: response regulator [Bacilli bacterium]|nr:response regulator [Bacilli bacterium]